MSYTAIYITSKESPCHYCQKHTPTCHGSCGDYAQFRANLDAKQQERKLRRDVDWAVSDAVWRMGRSRNV